MEISHLRTEAINSAEMGDSKPLADLLRDETKTMNPLERQWLASFIEANINRRQGHPISDNTLPQRIEISREFFKLTQIDGDTHGKAVMSLAAKFGISEKMIRNHRNAAKTCIYCRIQDIKLNILRK